MSTRRGVLAVRAVSSETGDSPELLTVGAWYGLLSMVFSNVRQIDLIGALAQFCCFA